MTDPTYRMSMLPFGTYPNEDGQGEHLGLAVPGMIQEPVNALMRLFGSGNFAQGPDYPGNADDMRTLLFSMYGGNALNPGRLLEGAAAKAAVPVTASEGLRPGLALARETAEGAPSAWWNIDMNGARIGRAYVREYPTSIQNSNFTIEPEFQRQGIGTEVQTELARRYGKPTVPDSTLSEAAYQRWLKNDPSAVADYNPWFEGASQYAPSPLSDNYYSSMGAGPSPGTRGAAGELFSDTGKPSLMGSAIAGAEGNTPLRGYRGARDEANIGGGDALWASSRPDVANSYAQAPSWDTSRTPSVAPVDFHFQNPMEIDAGGNLWHSLPQSLAPEARSDPFRFPDRFRPDLLTTDDLAELAKAKGHDGLVVRNVVDSLLANNAMPMSQPQGVSDVFAALKRGTVTSPLTGETLFSDGLPSLFGSALYQNQEPRNALMDYAQNDQEPGDYLKNYFDQPASPVPSTDPNLNYRTEITPEIEQQLHATAKPHVDFLIQHLSQAHPEWPRNTITSRAWQMYQKHPSDDYIELKKRLVPRLPY